MKGSSLIYIAVISLLMISCGNSSQKKTGWVSAHNLEVKMTKRDSLIATESDKAIANINFFISEQEFEKQKEIFYSDFSVDGDYGLTDYKIGDYQFFQIEGLFDDGELYAIIIRGYPVSHEYYDTDIRRRYFAIFNIFKAKYGDISFHSMIPDWHETTSGYSYTISRWELGKRWVELRISDRGTSHGVDVYIFRKDIKEKLDAAQKEEIENNAKSAIDKI